ncbi:hypothetical protein [Nostoc sp. 'Peltigera membranacea cyanobiont' 232]|uniref:hypothetical protein n=1 Tax=Nostoc sp. 'Peltigera membranacea cyanobiont' 232 TaxID=2014531 RepID=UPI00117E42C7|nr:hypothetical protein [Nostoc sp. 'Peltigera membranacea cyanobiont' 232]
MVTNFTYLISIVHLIVSHSSENRYIKAIYKERSKTESVQFLLKEIKDLPITEELKLKLKSELSPELNTNAQEVEIPKTV